MRDASRRLVHRSVGKPKLVGGLATQPSTVFSCRALSLRGLPGVGLAARASAPWSRAVHTQRLTVPRCTPKKAATSCCG